MDSKFKEYLERTIQELNQAASGIIHDIKEHERYNTNQAREITSQPKCSTLFPNADPILYEAITTQQKRNPYLQDGTPHQQTVVEVETQPEEEWGGFGPEKKCPDSDEKLPLPLLYAYIMVNHVRVPYTGHDSSYTWYYMFRNTVQQYGVLLIPVE
jgi:hypothetical protein